MIMLMIGYDMILMSSPKLSLMFLKSVISTRLFQYMRRLLSRYRTQFLTSYS